MPGVLLSPELERRAEAAIERVDIASERLRDRVWELAGEGKLSPAELAHLVGIAERFVALVEQLAGDCEAVVLEDRFAALLVIGDGIELVERAVGFLKPRFDPAVLAIRSEALRGVLGAPPP